jgi:hypothetical protein
VDAHHKSGANLFVTYCARRVINPLPVVLKPQPDELLSSWLARHATFYGIARRRLLDHVGLSTPSLEALDYKPSLSVQIMLAGFFHCEPGAIAAMSHAAVRDDLHCLVRRISSLQACRRCTEKGENAGAAGVVLKSWMQGWRITCRSCGSRLIDLAREKTTTNELDQTSLFSEHWDFAREGEEIFERHALGAVEAVPSPLTIMQLLLLPRWPEPGEMSAVYRQLRLLNVLLPGFDETVHQRGLKATWSTKLVLPIPFRVPLLAGLAIVMRDPQKMISYLRVHTRFHGTKRFNQIEPGEITATTGPVSH